MEYLSFPKPYRLSPYDFLIKIYWILKFRHMSNFSFVGHKFQKSKSADSGWKFNSWALFLVSLMSKPYHNYVKWRHCGHVLMTLHNHLVQNLTFWKPHKWLQTEKSLNSLTVSGSLNGFHFWKVECLSFLTHYQPSLYSYDL